MAASVSAGISYWPASEGEILQTTVGEVLRRAAAVAPEQLALVDGARDPAHRRRWTYAELLRDAERTARALLARFEPGDRIALCSPNCPEWVIAELGVALAGMVLVPINPAYRQAEIATILGAAEVAGIVHVEHFRDNPIGEMVVRLRQSLPHLRDAVALSDWDAFQASGNPATPLPTVRPDAIAIIQFTSGTTGTPKGACLRHVGILNSARLAAERAGFPERGVWVNGAPMYHVGGAVLTMLGTLGWHGTYVLMPEWDAGLALALIEAERGQAIMIVPTMILTMLDHPDFERYDLSSLRVVLSGAAAVAPTLVQRVNDRFGCAIVITFGQTESSGTFSLTSPDDLLADQCETLGRPLPAVEVAIVAPETGDIVPIGTPGEIRVRGFLTMQGYYGQGAASPALTPDGWLCTGDIGTMDARGYLRITGRIKEVVIRGGINIYPREIEEVLFDHPGVAQASVLGVPDAHWGECVAAVVIAADPTAPPSVEDLRSHCKARLAPHKAPSIWYFVTSYPLTPSGKVQKFALFDLIRDGTLTPA